MTETEETVLDPRSLVKALLQAHDDWSGAAGTPLYGEAADALNKAEAAVVAALSRAPEVEREGAAERLAIVAEKPAHLIRWGEGDRLDLQSVLAALSPPSTGGEGEDWDRIPRAKRFGRRLNESAVKHLAPGTLLRFYSEDPWFDPSPSSPANGDIVVFTGAVSNAFPKVGPHLEVRTLGGRVYPGGGWVYQIFQFVADPSPEMGEISREEIAREIDPDAWDRWTYTWPPGRKEKSLAKADAILSKLKENGLSREELGGLARSLPSGDAQERSPVPPISDGGGA